MVQLAAAHEGLSTVEALHRLHDDIQTAFNEFESTQANSKSREWLFDTFHHLSRHTTLHWITASVLTLEATALILAYFFTQPQDGYLPCNAMIILALLSINLYLVISDNRFRHQEIPKRILAILATLKLAIEHVKWQPENYPHLCTPFSPCVTMQWVYRDGHLVNLPWSLLSRGDLIVIRPGQLSPGVCESLEDDSDCPILHPKEIYGPPLPNANEVFSVPKAKIPLKNKLYRLIETPFINNLRVALEKSLKRPVTHFNNQRYLLVNKYLEMFTFPIVLISVLVCNFIKYLYLFDYVGYVAWTALFITQPIGITLPLLPLIFPMFWIGLNALGMARFKALFNTTSKKTFAMETDPFTETEHSMAMDLEFSHQWSEVWDIFFNIITGKEHMMTRSANILHVFGHLSALCVVDKKGILSWPNPTAEKIFFLRSSGSSSQASSMESVGDSAGDADSINAKLKPALTNAGKGTVTEVLDMTHNHNLPFQLEFDDHEWKQHMASLKPLGLAILLNTCNMDTQENYSQFCSHITCEAMYNENLVPVTNRRCLCELSKQIGFMDEAQSIFTVQEQVSTFRHLTDMVKRDKFARALHLTTKLKFPFPHMVAVVIKELHSGSHQLFSQGTADIILDSCVDYWDGKDLSPLSPSDRKKVTDFYSRTSLTAYCTAFAYRPLNRTIDKKFSQIYLELPSDSKHLYMSQRSPTPLHWDFKKGVLGQFHSTDSLLYNDNKEESVCNVEGCFEMQCNQVFIGMVTMQYQAQSDMVQLIERLEKACIRFVHFSKENELRSRVFSEKMGLESGWNCHISLLSEKPNTPECWANNGTTRVWSPSAIPLRVVNRYSESDKTDRPEEIHPLLLSTNLETAKPISQSAPSAINMEYSVVKFDEDAVIECGGDSDESQGEKSQTPAPKDKTTESENSEKSEKDSIMLQSIDLSQEVWPSLSCLTDSTEQSAPVNFDMSNRAKLPRGIENIRPHLEAIDNVPLLVSLFTDCTAGVTTEMLRIMQDYGQTVCVLGSAANSDNIEVFMQADASIAVEPLYPQVCQRTPVFTPVAPVHGPSPVGLSRTLNSLPCSLSFRREDPVSIFHLLLEARHYMLAFWNCVQFWVCALVTISFLQIAIILLLLPPLLSIGQVLWLICVIIPMLTTSLIGVKTDPAVMQRPAGKFHYTFNTEMAYFVFWCYCGKCLPLIVFVTITYGATLFSFCHNISSVTNTTSCTIVYPTVETETEALIGWDNYASHLFIAQHIAIFLTVLLLITISVSFVLRDHSIWKKWPNNTLWICCVVILLIMQIIYTTINLTGLMPSNQKDNTEAPTLEDLPWFIFVLLIAAPLSTFTVTESIKRHEIKINLRYLRRARLDFGTKLGMNSPF